MKTKKALKEYLKENVGNKLYLVTITPNKIDYEEIRVIKNVKTEWLITTRIDSPDDEIYLKFVNIEEVNDKYFMIKTLFGSEVRFYFDCGKDFVYRN